MRAVLINSVTTRGARALLALFFLGIACMSPAGANSHIRDRNAPELTALWTQLDTARGYRTDFAERNGDSRSRIVGGKSHAEILVSYEDTSQGTAPRDLLLVLIGPSGFAGFVDDPNASDSLRGEALHGLQEALSEHMAGEALRANDMLLQGLRTRYPGQDGGGATPQALLEMSVTSFRAALERAADVVRDDPDGFRASGIVNPSFSFFVENTPLPGDPLGEIVEAEYYRFTDLVNRYGIAANALAKQKFFFGNDTALGREEAASDFKNGAQAVYLGSVLLAATQTADNFQDNNGGELDRQITTAQKLYDDIQSGFNPLDLRGDFVPARGTNGVFDVAESQLQAAVCSEIAVRGATREYDTDQTALRDELISQTTSYLDQIEIVIGPSPPFPAPGDTSCDPPDQMACYFELPEHRDALMDIADPRRGGQKAIDYLKSCTVASICDNYRAWEASQIELRLAQQAMQNIKEQIQIEEERSDRITRVVTVSGIAISAIEVAEGIAVAATPEVSTEASIPPSVTTTFPVSAALSGIAAAGITTEEWLRDVEIENTESAATIRNLLLELAAASLSAERAALAVVEAWAKYDGSLYDLERPLRNYAASREALNEAYFTNPAYQLALDRAAQNADSDFESAMVAAYKATKALEYEWSERLANPVLDPDGPDRPIGDVSKFNPIVSAESVFTVRTAGSPLVGTPTLRTYVEALELWDDTMRSVRGPLRQPEASKVISLKRDVLGFDSPDEAFNRIAFRSYVASHRVPGLNPAKEDLLVEFPIQIFDQRLLPAQPNLKLVSIQVNLKPVPGRLLLESPDLNPALVSLVMEDQALLRTFFADYPNDDDFLKIDLEGSRSFRQSQFFALVQATIDGDGSATANTQLRERSPAVSSWSMRFEMDSGTNSKLLLENLDDVEIRFNYSFGHPIEFEFPTVVECP